MNVKERQLLSVRHASAHPSRVMGDRKVLLISSRPFSAQVLLAGGFGLGVADVQAADEVAVEVKGVVVVGQLVWNAVTVVVLVCFLSTVV